MDPTRACNQINELVTEKLAAQHSQVVFNDGRDPFQTVFFKESLKTFVLIPGGVALHYINYTRAAGLGRLKRWVGADRIRGSQENNVRELRDRLRQLH